MATSGFLRRHFLGRRKGPARHQARALKNACSWTRAQRSSAWRPGSFTKNGGTCAGLTIGISQPTLAAVIHANANGVASISFNAPVGLCGRNIGAVDLSSCAASNTLIL